MNKNWDNIDRQAELSGKAERKLRQYQSKTNHKPMLYNSVARTGEMPERTLRTHKTKRNKPNRMKYLYIKEPKVFSL